MGINHDQNWKVLVQFFEFQYGSGKKKKKDVGDVLRTLAKVDFKCVEKTNNYKSCDYMAYCHTIVY